MFALQVDRLGLNEYSETLYDITGEGIVSDFVNELDPSEDILRNIVFRMWESYYTSDKEVSIKRDATILQSCLVQMLKNFK